MSIANIHTNFVNLVEPRTLKATVFQPLSGSAALNSTTFTTLMGGIGAGSILTTVNLIAPTGSTGLSGGVTYTVSITGSNASLTGDVASFTGFQPLYPLQYYGGVVPQDSAFVVRGTGASGWTSNTPSVLVQYLN